MEATPVSFEINSAFQSLARRWFRVFRNLLSYLFFGIAIALILKGYSDFLLTLSEFLLLLAASYSYFLVRKILYKVTFSTHEKEIEFGIINNNQKKFYRFTLKEIKISFRQDYSYRYPLWVLYIYQNNKEWFLQKESTGWSEQGLKDIYELSRKLRTELIN